MALFLASLYLSFTCFMTSVVQLWKVKSHWRWHSYPFLWSIRHYHVQ